MTWTTPSTVVAGSTELTASLWNEQVRDNTNAIRDAQINVQQTQVDTATTISYTHPTPAALTGLSVSITPTSSDSDILIFAYVGQIGQSADSATSLAIYRDGTAIGVGAAAGNRQRQGSFWYPAVGITTNSSSAQNHTLIFLDKNRSSGTSAVTYDVRVAGSGSATFYWNRTQADVNNNSQVRASSQIVVMEVPV